jgi:adhesin/invasin
LAAACDKVPLLAPSGTVITLFPTASTVPVNGSIEIVATVIENGSTSTPPTTPPPGNGDGGTTTPPPGTTTTNSPGAGTPVHNGTVVTFTTTLGRIEPVEARTQNGQVRVRFISTGQSGLATITAFSGGASGRIENLRVGTAGAERVLITATPQALGCSGGTTQINARVEDTSGAGIPSVPVQFTTTTGQLNPATATTNDSGVATTQLTTTREAEVTANVAGKTETVTVTLSPRTGLALTPPTGTVSAGVATTFTVNVSADANIGSVVVDFGDGTVRNLGALSGSTTVPHTYDLEGTYTVTATAADAAGCTERVSTAVNILPAQPPDVRITAPQTARVNESVLVSATVSGATSTVVRYEWNFGPDAVPSTVSTSSRTVPVRWTTTGTKTITVRVIQANGVEGDAVAQIVITQ